MEFCLPSSPAATGHTQAGPLPITLQNPQLGQWGGASRAGPASACALRSTHSCPCPPLSSQQTSIYEDLRNRGSICFLEMRLQGLTEVMSTVRNRWSLGRRISLRS